MRLLKTLDNKTAYLLASSKHALFKARSVSRVLTIQQLFLFFSHDIASGIFGKDRRHLIGPFIIWVIALPRGIM